MKIDFEIEESSVLKGVKIITPSIFEEPRGSIWTSYLDSAIGSLLPEGISFKHDKFSSSLHNNDERLLQSQVFSFGLILFVHCL